MCEFFPFLKSYTRNNKAYGENRVRNKRLKNLGNIATRALTKTTTIPKNIPAEFMSHVKFLINITANINIGLYLYKKMEVTDEEIGKKVV